MSNAMSKLQEKVKLNQSATLATSTFNKALLESVQPLKRGIMGSANRSFVKMYDAKKLQINETIAERIVRELREKYRILKKKGIRQGVKEAIMLVGGLDADNYEEQKINAANVCAFLEIISLPKNEWKTGTFNKWKLKPKGRANTEPPEKEPTKVSLRVNEQFSELVKSVEVTKGVSVVLLTPARVLSEDDKSSVDIINHELASLRLFDFGNGTITVGGTEIPILRFLDYKQEDRPFQGRQMLSWIRPYPHMDPSSKTYSLSYEPRSTAYGHSDLQAYNANILLKSLYNYLAEIGVLPDKIEVILSGIRILLGEPITSEANKSHDLFNIENEEVSKYLARNYAVRAYTIPEFCNFLSNDLLNSVAKYFVFNECVQLLIEKNDGRILSANTDPQIEAQLHSEITDMLQTDLNPPTKALVFLNLRDQRPPRDESTFVQRIRHYAEAFNRDCPTKLSDLLDAIEGTKRKVPQQKEQVFTETISISERLRDLLQNANEPTSEMYAQVRLSLDNLAKRMLLKVPDSNIKEMYRQIFQGAFKWPTGLNPKIQRNFSLLAAQILESIKIELNKSNYNSVRSNPELFRAIQNKLRPIEPGEIFDPFIHISPPNHTLTELQRKEFLSSAKVPLPEDNIGTILNRHDKSLNDIYRIIGKFKVKTTNTDKLLELLPIIRQKLANKEFDAELSELVLNAIGTTNDLLAEKSHKKSRKGIRFYSQVRNSLFAISDTIDRSRPPLMELDEQEDPIFNTKVVVSGAGGKSGLNRRNSSGRVVDQSKEPLQPTLSTVNEEHGTNRRQTFKKKTTSQQKSDTQNVPQPNASPTGKAQKKSARQTAPQSKKLPSQQNVPQPNASPTGKAQKKSVRQTAPQSRKLISQQSSRQNSPQSNSKKRSAKRSIESTPKRQTKNPLQGSNEEAEFNFNA